MKISTAFAATTTAIAFTVAASGSALAQQATYDYPQAVTSQQSRADVVSALRLAQAEGRLHSGQADYTVPVRAVSTVTRAEVRAQTLAAIASGEVAELNRSHSNGFDVAAFARPGAVRIAGK